MNELYKIICVGSAFVGKTSLARRFTLNTFTYSYIPTLGVSWLTKSITLSPEQLNQNLTKEFFTEGANVRLTIWDTGGQEIFTYLRPKYYEGATCAIIVFDITNRASFDDVDIWVNEVVTSCPDAPIILCGNKYDLNEARAISKEEAIEYAKLHRFDYIETSALTSHNVNQLFSHAGRLAYQNIEDLDKFRKMMIL
ncbi:MAG: Rab family GTPase [Candidatus Heimdallarchaeaceae archaeon]